jgi:hypothetical protein
MGHAKRIGILVFGGFSHDPGSGLAGIFMHVGLAEVLSEQAFQFAVVLVGRANINPRRKVHVFARGAAAFDWYSVHFHEDY